MHKTLLKLKRASSRETIYKSLVWYLVLFALIPTVLVNFVYYNLASHYISGMSIKLGQEMIVRVSSELELMLESITRTADGLANNSEVQEALRMDFGDDLAAKYAVDLAMDGELSLSNPMQPQVAGITILGENGGEYKSHAQAFLEQNHTRQTWYQQIKLSSGFVWFPPHEGRFANVSDKQQYITCGRSIYDKISGEVTGVLIVEIEERVIKDIISSQLGESGYLLVLDENNKVLSSPDNTGGYLTNLSSVMGSKTEGTFAVELEVWRDGETECQDVVATYMEMPITGWKVMGIIPESRLNEQGHLLVLLTAILSLVIIGAAIFTAMRISNRVVTPINRLKDAMKQVEDGDLEVNLDYHQDIHYEEVRKLDKSFNLMVSKVKGLMDDVYKEQSKLRKAQLKTLQSQINPHFLYNTLDSILWLNREGNKEAVNTMVESLTTFFRVGISRGKDIITIREEVKHLESYLKIQYLRYGDRFTYDIEVDESAMEFKIPKLTLQPLAENAIYHGIKQKRENGKINVRIFDTGDEVLVVVTDTGQGMNAEMVSKLNRTLRGEKVEGIELYGVKNIQQRLRILFGDKATLHYESKEEVGTIVTVKIPHTTRVEEEFLL